MTQAGTFAEQSHQKDWKPESVRIQMRDDFNSVGSDTPSPQRAYQTIYHDHEGPSRLFLPVIATPKAGK
jgi:hypothetical protein